MRRRTFTGSLAAAAVVATAFNVPAAHASPTWLASHSISGTGAPTWQLDVAMGGGLAVATWIREVNGEDLAFAASAKNGVWGSAFALTTRPSSKPAVAVNEHGEAVVTWLEYHDGFDRTSVAMSRRLPTGNWDGKDLVSSHPSADAAAQDVAMDDNGVSYIAYLEKKEALDVVRAAIWDGDNPATSQAVSDGSAADPSISVNSQGDALVAFRDIMGADDTIRASHRPRNAASWGPAVNVSQVGDHGQAETRAAINDSGFGIVAFTRTTDGVRLVESVKMQPDGEFGGVDVVSPAGEAAYFVDLELNDDGRSLLVWNRVKDAVVGLSYARGKQDAGWSDAKLTLPVANPSRPQAALGQNGTMVVTVRDSDHIRTAYQSKPQFPFTNLDTGDINAQEAGAAGDEQGNVLVAGSVLPDALTGQVLGQFFDTAGPVTGLTSPKANTLAPKVALAWTGDDVLSDYISTDVRVRSAAWNGTFGSQTIVLDNTTGTTAKVAAKQGRTYCFATQGRDSVGNSGLWSAERCTTTPLDDRKLTRSKGWQRGSSASHYRGTWTQSTTKGSILSLNGVKASRLALVVTKFADGGKIQVRLAGKKLGTWSLKGHGTKRIINLAKFAGVRSGKLVVKVTSANGKRVRIDGVIAGK